MHRWTRARLGSLTVSAALALVGTSAVAFAAPPGAYDRPGKTERVSVASNGAQASYPPAEFNGFQRLATGDVSSNGLYVVFESNASNLVPHLTAKSGTFQVYWHDRRTGAIRLVSVASDGTPGLLDSSSPRISADGRYVAFASVAPNLVPGDTDAAGGIFRHDVRTGRTIRVSVANDGSQARNGVLSAGVRHPSISGDGQRIAFETEATNLAPGADGTNVYVRDLRTRKTILVSVGVDGKPSGRVRDPGVSGNGRYVVFTGKTGLVRGVEHTRWAVYVRDLKARKTVLASVASDGTPAQSGPLSCGEAHRRSRSLSRSDRLSKTRSIPPVWTATHSEAGMGRSATMVVMWRSSATRRTWCPTPSVPARPAWASASRTSCTT